MESIGISYIGALYPAVWMFNAGDPKNWAERGRPGPPGPPGIWEILGLRDSRVSPKNTQWRSNMLWIIWFTMLQTFPDPAQKCEVDIFPSNDSWRPYPHPEPPSTLGHGITVGIWCTDCQQLAQIPSKNSMLKKDVNHDVICYINHLGMFKKYVLRCIMMLIFRDGNHQPVKNRLRYTG